MKIMIETQGTMAIYEQIEHQIKSQIIGGGLRAGDALPSIRALAAQLEISVITTKRAYEELEKEGLIRSVAGKGFYVSECNSDYLQEKQLVMLEKQMTQAVRLCKKSGLNLEETLQMVTALYEEE